MSEPRWWLSDMEKPPKTKAEGEDKPGLSARLGVFLDPVTRQRELPRIQEWLYKQYYYGLINPTDLSSFLEELEAVYNNQKAPSTELSRQIELGLTNEWVQRSYLDYAKYQTEARTEEAQVAYERSAQERMRPFLTTETPAYHLEGATPEAEITSNVLPEVQARLDAISRMEASSLADQTTKRFLAGKEADIQSRIQKQMPSAGSVLEDYVNRVIEQTGQTTNPTFQSFIGNKLLDRAQRFLSENPNAREDWMRYALFGVEDVIAGMSRSAAAAAGTPSATSRDVLGSEFQRMRQFAREADPLKQALSGYDWASEWIRQAPAQRGFYPTRVAPPARWI